MGEHPRLESGTTLGGRFELTEEIGEGGFGKIYRGRQLNIDREVAVKVLPPKFASVDNVVERFRREARLASRLRHPNTITIHDYGRQDDFFFIAMEYLEGEDLAERLDRIPMLPMDQAVHIGTQTLRSLREAHSMGIVHRDLKPENVFLTRMNDDADYVKVLDFGIAKLAGQNPELLDAESEDGRSLTVQGSTVGTPAYMSPEQAAGEEVDAVSDLYTVGVILFEMVNGRPPFKKERPAQTMRAHLFDSVPAFPNEQLRNTRFESVVRTALAKEPEQRFDSADEFLEVLSAPDLDARSLGAFQLGAGESAREDSGPTTAPDTPTRTRSTPSPDASSPQESSPAPEEVPFEVVPDRTDGDDAPPRRGFSAADAPEGSSILTVLDEPPDDEEVIVLTKKKKRASREDAEHDDRSGPDGDDQPVEPRDGDPSVSSAVAQPDTPDNAGDTSSRPGPDSGDDEQTPPRSHSPRRRARRDDWNWDGGVKPADASGSQILTEYASIRRRRRLVAIVAVLLVSVAALVVGLVLAGVISIPG